MHHPSVIYDLNRGMHVLGDSIAVAYNEGKLKSNTEALFSKTSFVKYFLKTVVENVWINFKQERFSKIEKYLFDIF